MNRQIQDEAVLMIHLAEKNLLWRCPFYARLVTSWKKVPWEKDTMGVALVNECIHLCYNAEFVCNLGIDSLTAVLEHEMFHVLFGHIFLAAERFENPSALLIACEVTANEYVFNQKHLPGKPQLLDDWGLEPGETTLDRYRRLCMDSRVIHHTPPPFDDHGGWNNKSDGSHHNRQEQIRQRRQSPLPWASIFSPYLRLDRNPDFSKPSRRLPDLIGIVPGCRLFSKAPKVLAAIDTSGSMEMDVLDGIRNEIDAIAHIASRVILVECDSEITCIHDRYRPGQLSHINGRGDTDLRPPFDLLPRYKPDLLVYFTDGDGPMPDGPFSTPVIWCLTRDSEAPVPWGKVVYLNFVPEQLPVLDSKYPTIMLQ